MCIYIYVYICIYIHRYTICCIHPIFSHFKVRRQVEDSVQLFTSDTLTGGAKKPELVKVLCGNSGPDVPRRQMERSC